jgi:hypothetical protein
MVKIAVCGSDSTLAAPAVTQKEKAATAAQQIPAWKTGRPVFIALLSRNQLRPP